MQIVPADFNNESYFKHKKKLFNHGLVITKKVAGEDSEPMQINEKEYIFRK